MRPASMGGGASGVGGGRTMTVELFSPGALDGIFWAETTTRLSGDEFETFVELAGDEAVSASLALAELEIVLEMDSGARSSKVRSGGVAA